MQKKQNEQNMYVNDNLHSNPSDWCVIVWLKSQDEETAFDNIVVGGGILEAEALSN